ncbi:hypothetical protein LDENG_00066230 [Lucifuga dentata]|nr:hypothetical protein LDENG_00066230 [Lucifuga dentata]
MVGGHLVCLSFFKYISLLLLAACLHAQKASNCPSIINKKVGDSVELPSCLPSKGVSSAAWRHGDTEVVNKDHGVNQDSQFKDRAYLKSTNFSLTLKNLSLIDSGNFSFISDGPYGQRETIIITLQVHEAITMKPTLNVKKTWNTSNRSCHFLLECNAAPYNQVTFEWKMTNQSHAGSRLQFTLMPQEGNITVTCMISNIVSNSYASTSVECSNSMSINSEEEDKGQGKLVTFLTVAAGVCLLIVILVVVAVGVYLCKQRQTAAGDLNDLTVYADISETTNENRNSLTNPSSVYATIDDRVNSVAPGAQTVYDKIHMNRLKISSSPYQDINHDAQQKI